MLKYNIVYYCCFHVFILFLFAFPVNVFMVFREGVLSLCAIWYSMSAQQGGLSGALVGCFKIPFYGKFYTICDRCGWPGRVLSGQSLVESDRKCAVPFPPA